MERSPGTPGNQETRCLGSFPQQAVSQSTNRGKAPPGGVHSPCPSPGPGHSTVQGGWGIGPAVTPTTPVTESPEGGQLALGVWCHQAGHGDRGPRSKSMCLRRSWGSTCYLRSSRGSLGAGAAPLTQLKPVWQNVFSHGGRDGDRTEKRVPWTAPQTHALAGQHSDEGAAKEVWTDAEWGWGRQRGGFPGSEICPGFSEQRSARALNCSR